MQTIAPPSHRLLGHTRFDVALELPEDSLHADREAAVDKKICLGERLVPSANETDHRRRFTKEGILTSTFDIDGHVFTVTGAGALFKPNE